MTILLLGQTGQVGFELKRLFATLGEVIAPTRAELDLLDEVGVSAYLARYRPELILNAAAYTAVDKAEHEPLFVARLNAKLAAQLAEYATASNATLIHYSSDYVYPGQGKEPYGEQDETGPLSVYGQTKLDGDRAITASGCRNLIFRTSWVYSARGHNFMKTMIRLGQEKSKLNVVADQFGSPTPARLIAQLSFMAYLKNIYSGVYHLAPRGETSWHGFAQTIFEQYALSGRALAISPETVHPIATTDYPTPAKRPLNSRLNVTKLEQALSIQLPCWRAQLKLTLAEYLEHERILGKGRGI